MAVIQPFSIRQAGHDKCIAQYASQHGKIRALWHPAEETGIYSARFIFDSTSRNGSYMAGLGMATSQFFFCKVFCDSTNPSGSNVAGFWTAIHLYSAHSSFLFNQSKWVLCPLDMNEEKNNTVASDISPLQCASLHRAELTLALTQKEVPSDTLSL